MIGRRVARGLRRAKCRARTVMPPSTRIVPAAASVRPAGSAVVLDVADQDHRDVHVGQYSRARMPAWAVRSAAVAGSDPPARCRPPANWPPGHRAAGQRGRRAAAARVPAGTGRTRSRAPCTRRLTSTRLPSDGLPAGRVPRARAGSARSAAAGPAADPPRRPGDHDHVGRRAADQRAERRSRPAGAARARRSATHPEIGPHHRRARSAAPTTPADVAHARPPTTGATGSVAARLELAGEGGPGRGQQQLAGLDHAAADHQDLRVEQLGQVGQAAAEPAADLANAASDAGSPCWAAG